MDNESFVLYKYRAINERLIKSLINQTLYFATPDKLNDPFDCRIDLQKAIERAVISATGQRRDFLSSFLATPEFCQYPRQSRGLDCVSRSKRLERGR